MIRHQLTATGTVPIDQLEAIPEVLAVCIYGQLVELCAYEQLTNYRYCFTPVVREEVYPLTHVLVAVSHHLGNLWNYTVMVTTRDPSLPQTLAEGFTKSEQLNDEDRQCVVVCDGELLSPQVF